MFQNGPLTIKLTCSASFFVKNESAIRKRHPLKGMDKNLISYTEAGGMHMKKIICLWLCLFVLCACTKPGSFEDGNIDMEKVIEVKNLYKLYRVGDEVVRALDGVDFNIYKGEFCAIVGTSGSGKSTLLNMLAGLEKPTKGEVIISGEHIEKKNEEELVKFRRDNVGFIFQSFHLLGTMNAVENVALPLSFRGVPKDVRLKKADKMLDLVNLGKHKKHMPNQMSGGQQQRVGVARALVVDPKIIFADEPTGNLDSHTSEEVMELMQQVVRQQKKTLVMVTHDNHLATYADRVFHISDGKIIKIEDHRSGTEHTEDRDKAISGNMNPQDTEYLKR